MASIRDTILAALVARLDAIAGWSATLRGTVNTGVGASVQAIVYFVSEDKSVAGNDAYDCTMQVVVWIQAAEESASPSTDGGNPYRYLDRLVTAAEKVVHAPDSWGPAPTFADVEILGHDVLDPSEANIFGAFLRLQFRYRHSLTNPEVVA